MHERRGQVGAGDVLRQMHTVALRQEAVLDERSNRSVQEICCRKEQSRQQVDEHRGRVGRDRGHAPPGSGTDFALYFTAVTCDVQL